MPVSAPHHASLSATPCQSSTRRRRRPHGPASRLDREQLCLHWRRASTRHRASTAVTRHRVFQRRPRSRSSPEPPRRLRANRITLRALRRQRPRRRSRRSRHRPPASDGCAARRSAPGRRPTGYRPRTDAGRRGSAGGAQEHLGGGSGSVGSSILRGGW